MCILFDTGTTSSLVLKDFVDKRQIKNTKTTCWNTKGGTFQTQGQCTAQIFFPKFENNKGAEWTFHVNSTSKPSQCKYDMIIGSNLMDAIGIDIMCSTNSVVWGDHSLPMKPKMVYEEPELNEMWFQDLFESHPAQKLVKMLDNDYTPADLDKVVQECKCLNHEEQKSLLKLMKKHQDLFQGKLGTWKCPPVDLELKEGATPFHRKLHVPPHAHLAQTKKECECLCKVGVLHEITQSEWGHPTFIIPKKDDKMRWMTDLCELNKRIKRKPYPLPNIHDLMLTLEGFTHATALDSNMGCYHIKLMPKA